MRKGNNLNREKEGEKIIEEAKEFGSSSTCTNSTPLLLVAKERDRGNTNRKENRKKSPK
jgi:hypothetical protein